jgi:hypothetical protein
MECGLSLRLRRLFSARTWRYTATLAASRVASRLIGLALAERRGRSGKTESAIASMKWRGGFPVPVTPVGGRPAVTVYDMARWLAGDADGAEEASTGEDKATPRETVSVAPNPIPASALKHGGKRDHKSLGKMLIGLRGQREFLAQLDAEIEAEILAEEVAEAAAASRARDAAGSDGDEGGSSDAAPLSRL